MKEDPQAILDRLIAESEKLLTELHEAGHSDLINKLLESWEQAKQDLVKATEEK